MSDNFNTNAEVGIDVSKAVSALNKLISGIADLQERAPQSARALEALERQAVQIANSLNKGTAAIKGQAAAIETLTAQYNRFGLAGIRNASRVQRELQSAFNLAGQRISTQQNAAFDSYAPNIARSGQLARMYDEQAAYARRANEQMVRDSARAREQELSGLRSAILERNRLQEQSARAQVQYAAQVAREQATYARRANEQMVRDSARAREQELSGLRNAIIERNRLQEQSSRAQIQYAAQATRAGVQYGDAIRDVNNGLANQRYALYDVATTWGLVSAATLAAAAASITIAIDYQKNFASVQRTVSGTQEQILGLKDTLIDLSTSLPTSFADLSAIATLGGQLGINAAGIEDFTRVVAQLTATTNLSAEAAGTALGRFQSLLDVPSSQFENLGSSILKVGVNSVATETQIVNTATQISSMGEFAGLTADQVIGLSGALASVGAQPELARGTITRVFTEMSQAVANGGTELEEFARLSSTSAADFQAAWGTERFAKVFQDFLKGIATEGNASVKTLNDLGIASSRDVPLLLRLASSQEVVNEAFQSAKTGYEDGTELQRQYAITSETVAAKLTILGNSLKALLEAPGSATLGPIAGIVDMLSDLANGLRLFASTDVGKVFGVIAISAFGLIGVLTGLRAMQALVTASSYAMTIAYRELNGTVHAARPGMTGLIGQMAALTVGTQRATAAQTAYNASLAAGNGRFASLAAGARAGATAVNGLAGAFRTAAVAGGWLAVIGVGVAALTSFAQKNQEAKARVDELTDSLNQQTGAITDATEATVWKTLVDSGVVARAKEVGFSLDTLRQAATGNRDAINELRAAYEQWNNVAIQTTPDWDGAAIDEAAEKQQKAFDEASAKADTYNDILQAITGTSGDVAAAQERLSDAQAAGIATSSGVAEEVEDLTGSLQDLLDTQYELVGGTVAVQNALFGLGESIAQNGANFDAYSVGGRENLAALQQALSAMVGASGGDAQALATMIAGLMQMLGQYGVDTVNQLAFVQAALAQLTGGKGVGGLTGVQNAAAQAGNALSQGFSSGAQKAAKSVGRAGKSAGGAAKEIKTLTDYVSDLQGVFNAAYDIRFGLDQSIDKVADAYAKLAEYADNAREEVIDAQQAIRNADAEIQGLNAANQTLEYQLIVAREYGDTLRANEILAEIAKNNAEIAEQQEDRAKSSKDLSKAEASLNKTLDGSTEQSREQRDMVLGLVKAYEDQVLALANSGLSQQEVARRTQELKNQFIAQLTQMGYNRAEVARYAAAFDDLTLAIQRVPRNITVNADVSPAQRAIDEFMARNANKSTSVGVGLNVPDGGTTYGLGQSAGAAYADGWNQAVAARRRLIVQPDGSVPGGQRYSVDGGKTWFLSKGGSVGSGVQYHSAGGVHGMHPGSPRGSDTTPAWLTPGEYVHNRSAVDYYGLPFMNALNNMQIPRYMAMGGATAPASSGAPMIQLVELLPSQLQQLASMLNTQLSMDGRIVAEATNNANSVSARRGSN